MSYIGCLMFCPFSWPEFMCKMLENEVHEQNVAAFGTTIARIKKRTVTEEKNNNTNNNEQ